MASQDLQWLLVRNNTSFVVKQKGLGRIFSREPSNLVQLHSYKYSGLVNTRSVGVEAAPGGFLISTKKTKAAAGAIKGTRSVSIVKKGGSRRAAGVVSNAVAKQGYRADVAAAAIARASAILRSQRSRKAAYPKKARGVAAQKEVVAESA